MDTDGHVDGLGRAEFRSTEAALGEGVHELARSLGLVPRLHVGPITVARRDCGMRYDIRFKPTELPVFRLSPKAARQRATRPGAPVRHRRVVEVRPIASVPVRCIQVDAPSHLYLAGRACIPTHNTSFVLNVALHAAVEQKKQVAIFSLEMSKEQLVERMLCEQARIDAQRLHRGLLSDVEYERLAGALGPLGDAPVYIDDSPMLDDLTLRLKARQARTREGIEMIILDYLQLMHGRSRSDDGNRVQEVSAISRALKSIARELKVPVIAISQLSRAPEARPDKRPILSDLRESGCLTADTRLLRADTGRPLSFAELLERGWEDVVVWSVDEGRRLQPAPLLRVFASGVKPVFRLRLAGGAEVKASANHRFLTRMGWRQLRHLRLGEGIAVTRRAAAPLAASGWPHAGTGQELGPGGTGAASPGALLVRPATDYVVWDRVAALEPLGEQPVYDATVAGTHNFIADGIVAHNSIEQDADIVTFLYRDDYYNREKSEKPGIAEVIVAKHRNGPTGTVELVFRKELTRFENLERRRPEVSPSPA
jgi:replicative DNA helicase